MKPFLAVLALLGLAIPASAQITSEQARVNYAYDVTSTSYVYCKYTGTGGNPFGEPIPGPGTLVTSGSSTTVTQETTGMNPFTEVAVGDLLFISSGGTVSVRLVTARASATSITVNTAIDLAVGTHWSWLKRSCGATIDDGWVDVGGFYNVTFSRTIATINAGSIETTAECRLNDNPTVATTLATNTTTGTGNWGWTLTSGVWDACRLGVKLTADAGAQSITSAMAVSKLNNVMPLNPSNTVTAVKDLTEGAATVVVQIGVPQTAEANFADGVVDYLVVAWDATNTQSLRGSSYLAAVNEGGTEACTVGAIGTTIDSTPTGTLSCTPTCVVGLTDAVQFALNCTSSLTQTALKAVVRVDRLQGNTVLGQ